MSRDEWIRLLIHIPHGIGMGAGVLFNAPLGLSWTGLCIAYQYLEDWRIGDESYLDMRGYMTGLPLGVILYWLATWY